MAVYRLMSRGARRVTGAALWTLTAASLSLTAKPAGADELAYQNCMRQLCSSGQDQVICARSCLKDLNDAPQYSPMPRPPTLWGAIALDQATLATGSAKDYPSRADAERRAIAICRRAGGSAQGCKVIRAQHNSCLALATSQAKGGTAWGEAYSDDGWASRREAARQCRTHDASCQVVISFCTG